MYLRMSYNVFGFGPLGSDLRPFLYRWSEGLKSRNAVILLVKLPDFDKLAPIAPTSSPMRKSPPIPKYTLVYMVIIGIGRYTLIGEEVCFFGVFNFSINFTVLQKLQL